MGEAEGGGLLLGVGEATGGGLAVDEGGGATLQSELEQS